jgi:hypothetical protein
MALRDDIQKRIDKKRSEIAALEAQMRNATVYIQALEDTLRMLPREASDAAVSSPSGQGMRAGSKVDKAREAIRKAGKPMHITELVPAIGRPNNAKNRAALAGSLSAYARRGETFTRPAPNTFGLLESLAKVTQNGHAPDTGPPPNFGIDLAKTSLMENSAEDEG